MTSLLIFIIQVWLMTAFALVLHHQVSRVGLVPLLFYIAGLVVILNTIELLAMEIEVFPNLILRTGGHVYVTVILSIVLLLYVASGTRPAQLVIAGLTGLNGLVVVAMIFLILYSNLDTTSAIVAGQVDPNDVFTLIFLRGVIASTLAFFSDMLIITIVYQGISNAYPKIWRWIAVGIALTISLWVDSAVFNIFFHLGTQNFSRLIPGDILAKTVAAIIAWIPLAFYLEQIAPKLDNYMGVEGRPTFSILFGTFGSLNRSFQQLQKELAVSRLTYQELTDHIDEIFWLADKETRRFVYISPAFERITGFPADYFYPDSNRILEVVHPDDRQIRTDNVINFLLSVNQNEFRVKHKNGDYRWLRNRPFPIYNDKGEIYRYAGIAMDFTTEKLHQQKDVELAISNEKMRVLHDFIRDASHDLKTPINAIILKADMVTRAKDEESRNRMRDELKERAVHLSNLIDDLFTLSRIEGYDVFVKNTIDLHHVLDDVLKSAMPILQNKGLAYQEDRSPQPLHIIANYDQIQRVLMNLLGNAIRYTETGIVHLKTWLEEDTVCLSVTDTGIGIPPEAIYQVFERFFRTEAAHSSTTGTGLGLAITKAIIEKHDGQISVESVLGEGSTFTIKFPHVISE